MGDIIKNIKKRHEKMLDYYTTEVLTERERNILRSEMSYLLSLLDEIKDSVDNTYDPESVN